MRSKEPLLAVSKVVGVEAVDHRGRDLFGDGGVGGEQCFEIGFAENEDFAFGDGARAGVAWNIGDESHFTEESPIGNCGEAARQVAFAERFFEDVYLAFFNNI